MALSKSCIIIIIIIIIIIEGQLKQYFALIGS